MTDTPGTADEISREARMIAARVREQAARGPSPEELARIAADALGVQGRDMSAGEIRHLAVTALTQAQQVSYLLGKLAALLEEGNR